MTRSITFAGPLQPGDCFQDGERTGLIGIDRKQPYPPVYRSPRPGRFVSVGRSAVFAGMAIGSIPGTDQFAALVADFEPGCDLEAWLPPVVDFSFDFLVTPADPP